jgi:hypothetical protein
MDLSEPLNPGMPRQQKKKYNLKRESFKQKTIGV